MSTLHDRITALATYRVHHVNMGLCPEGPDDPSRDPDCEVCGWLAETTTAQPEADAVERAARVLWEDARQVQYENGEWSREVIGEPVEPERLGAAASWGGPDDPVEDGETWPEFPVEPEPDEREALAAAVDEAARQWSQEPDLGDESDESIWTAGFLAGHTAGFRRSRPEATPERDATPDEAHDIGYTKGHTDGYREGWAEAPHTVTAERLRDVIDAAGAAWVPVSVIGEVLAAIGVTVADTPTQAGDDA